MRSQMKVPKAHHRLKSNETLVRRALLASLIACAASLSSWADPDTEPALAHELATLAECLNYAEANNPGLQAAVERTRAASERIPQAGALPDPRFGYSIYMPDIRERRSDRRQGWWVSQEFPWLGKRSLDEAMAADEARSTEEAYNAARWKLRYDVTKAYAEYYYLARSLEVTRESMELLKQFEEAARTRYKASLGSHPDLIRVQVELGKLHDELRTMEDMQPAVVARLNALLGRSAEASLPWPRALPKEPVVLPQDDLVRELRESSPELRAIEHSIQREERAVSRAKKEFYPDVMLELGYMDMRSTGMQGSGMPDEAMIGVSVNVPIWQRKYRAAVSEAQARRLAAQREKEDRENALTAEVRMAIYGLRSAARKMSLYHDTLIPKGKESLETTAVAFRTGEATFLELLEAQRTLLEFRIAYERALADYVQRVAELEMLLGRTLPHAPTSLTTSRDH